MLERSNIADLIIMISCWCVLRNNLIHGSQAPLSYVQIAKQLVPGLEAILPGIKPGKIIFFTELGFGGMMNDQNAEMVIG